MIKALAKKRNLKLCALLLCSLPVLADPPELVSRAPDPLYFGVAGTRSSEGCTLDENANYVAFSSYAQNLVADDNNGMLDVFLLQRQTGALLRISENSSGEGGTGLSHFPFLSADGSYVAFSSEADNLVSGDTNGRYDAFRYHIATGTLERISLGPGNTELPNGITRIRKILSADGSKALLILHDDIDAADTNGFNDAYLRDLNTGALTLLSVNNAGQVANRDIYNAVLSADGLTVAMETPASNLDGSDTNNRSDIYIRDLSAGTTTRIPGLAGAEPNADPRIDDISADGSKVVFHSGASNLVAGDTNGLQDVFVYDTGTATVTRVSVDSTGVQSNGTSMDGAIDASGRFVAFRSTATNLDSADSDSAYDIYVHDLQTGDTRLVSLDANDAHPAGGSNATEPCISFDVANNIVRVGFTSDNPMGFAEDINQAKDVFIRNTASGTTSWISKANASGPHPVYTGNQKSHLPSLSQDGRQVAFATSSSNLSGASNGFDNIVLLNIETGTYELVSVGLGGSPTDGSSSYPSVNQDASKVAFESSATNLYPALDTNNSSDIFVRTIGGGTVRISGGSTSLNEANGASKKPKIAANADVVVFESDASNLVTNDTNGSTRDIFAHDLQTGVTELISRSSTGTQGSDNCYASSVSGDGRYVTFHTSSSELVANDTNNTHDVFLHDRSTGTTTRVSVSSGNQEGNGRSDNAMISADGQWVVFRSYASNLVANDNNDAADIFIRDLVNDTTELVSLDDQGQPLQDDSLSTAVSQDGRFVLFATVSQPDAVTGIELYHVYVRDRLKNRTYWVNETSNPLDLQENISSYLAISGNGFVNLFSTDAAYADSLDKNGYLDLYGKDIDRFKIDSFE